MCVWRTLPVSIYCSAPVSTTSSKSFCAARIVKAQESQIRRLAQSARSKQPSKALKNGLPNWKPTLRIIASVPPNWNPKVGAPFEHEERYPLEPSSERDRGKTRSHQRPGPEPDRGRFMRRRHGEDFTQSNSDWT